MAREFGGSWGVSASPPARTHLASLSPPAKPNRPRPPNPNAANPRSAAERLAETKRMLREADTNGDGKVSREEFGALLRESVAPDSLSLYDSRLRVRGPRPADRTAAAA